LPLELADDVFPGDVSFLENPSRKD